MSKNKSKILIVEDEPIIASDIEMILEDAGYIVTGIEDSAEDALESMENELPDLVLLDINIEGDVDGVMLAQDINEKYKIPFVFLTSNADNLTINRVKRTKPAGFVLKPFSENDLKSNIEIALFSAKNKGDISEDISEFYVKERGALVRIKLSEILFIKADDNYSLIFTENKKHMISSTLKKLYEKISTSYLVRVHRSYVANTRFIEKIKDGCLYIGEHKLPIGNSYHDDLFEKINKL